jgi:hypothetical protein
MSQTLDQLNVILGNIQNNKANIVTQLGMINSAAVTPEVQAAMDLLITTFSSNVQLIGQAIGQQLQVEALTKTSAEIDVLIAAMQTVIADQTLVDATEAQITANAGTDAPLPGTAGASQSSAVDAGTDGTAPVAPAAPVADGTVQAPSAANDGTSSS